MILEKSIIQGVENHKYQVKLAESESEVNEALGLRYKVFSNELNRKFKFTDKIDYDEFDDQCHHLLVIEKESDRVIGTYRLQTYHQAVSGNGFVTSKRFELEKLPVKLLEQSFEVGRVCIDADHRNGRVLFLLWKGLAAYLKHFGLRYLFGYSALDTNDTQIAYNTYNHLLENELVNREYQVPVREEYRMDFAVDPEKEGKVDIPPLLNNYLNVGTKVCSEPAYDAESKLYHLFILLDVHSIDERTRKMFFG